MPDRPQVYVQSRFGMNNFNESWFDSRLEMLERFAIPCLENNLEAVDVHWGIATNSDTPSSVRRRLNRTLARSRLAGRAQVVPVEYPSMTRDALTAWVKTWAKPGEPIIVGRYDPDDFLGPNMFQRVAELFESEDVSEGVVSLDRGWAVDLDRMTYAEYRAPWFSQNVWYLTRNRSVSPFMVPHAQQGEYARRHGMRVIQTDDPHLSGLWGYSYYTASDAARYRDGRDRGGLPVSDELFGLPDGSFESFAAMVDLRPDVGYLVPVHPLEKAGTKQLERARGIKIQYIESVNMFDDEKSHLYAELRASGEACWVGALRERYAIPVASDRGLTSIITPGEYLARLSADPEDVVILYSWSPGDPCAEVRADVASFLGGVAEGEYIVGARGASLTARWEKRGKARVFAEGPLRIVGSHARNSPVVDLVAAPRTALVALDSVQLSMNVPGLNLVVWNSREKAVVDVVSIEGDELRRRR